MQNTGETLLIQKGKDEYLKLHGDNILIYWLTYDNMKRSIYVKYLHDNLQSILKTYLVGMLVIA